jgi:hypothetical protein
MTAASSRWEQSHALSNYSVATVDRASSGISKYVWRGAAVVS